MRKKGKKHGRKRGKGNTRSPVRAVVKWRKSKKKKIANRRKDEKMVLEVSTESPKNPFKRNRRKLLKKEIKRKRQRP